METPPDLPSASLFSEVEYPFSREVRKIVYSSRSLKNLPQLLCDVASQTRLEFDFKQEVILIILFLAGPEFENIGVTHPSSPLLNNDEIMPFKY